MDRNINYFWECWIKHHRSWLLNLHIYGTNLYLRSTRTLWGCNGAWVMVNKECQRILTKISRNVYTHSGTIRAVKNKPMLRTINFFFILTSLSSLKNRFFFQIEDLWNISYFAFWCPFYNKYIHPYTFPEKLGKG